MLSKLKTLVVLTTVAQAGIAGLTVAGTEESPTGYMKYYIPGTAPTNVWMDALKGYSCIRNGRYYSFPMTTTAANAITVPNPVVGSTIQTFYPIKINLLGSQNTNTAGTPGQNSGCFLD